MCLLSALLARTINSRLPVTAGADVFGNNIGATTEPSETATSSSSPRSVWYTFTAPATREYTVQLADSSIDTVVDVYRLVAAQTVQSAVRVRVLVTRKLD